MPDQFEDQPPGLNSPVGSAHVIMSDDTVPLEHVTRGVRGGIAGDLCTQVLAGGTAATGLQEWF